MTLPQPHLFAGKERSLLKVLAILVFLVLGSSSGCAFSRGNLGDEFKQEDVAKIKKGETSRAEVVATLGAPDRIIPLNGRDMFQYYRYDLKSSSLLLILVNFSRFNVKSDDLYILFNRDGVVEEVVLGKRTDRLTFQFWPFGE